jgi:CRISPR/Cas system-associated protein Cas10 (large subunit of type III CRISPR-Cas system)
MTKSQQYFQDMMEYNKELFDEFKIIHDKFASDEKKYREEFNEVGERVQVIIRKYENLLCSHAEGGKFGKFSDKTADTFWKYIRGAFPKIDFIGIK